MLKSKIQNAAGSRNNYVTIQVATDGDRTASGDVNPEYLTEFGRWVEEMMTSGREMQIAMQTVAMLQGVIRLPYDEKTALITARDRVVNRGRVLNIASPPINVGGSNETILLYVVEPE